MLIVLELGNLPGLGDAVSRWAVKEAVRHAEILESLFWTQYLLWKYVRSIPLRQLPTQLITSIVVRTNFVDYSTIQFCCTT